MTKTFQYEFDMADEGTETWDVQIEYSTVTDRNYGADADGNRGMEVTFIEDVKFQIFDPKGKDITNTVMETWNGDYVAIEKEVQAYVDGGM